MSHILLIGAGFSRNWGGWLANEAFEYLLGCPGVDAGIRYLLWKHRRSGGFEAALAELQEDHRRRNNAITAQNLQKLQQPILQMFSDMNFGFKNVDFEFQTNVQFLVRTFLTRFEAIFSLNQDLLIEHHYLNNRGPWGAGPELISQGLNLPRGPVGALEGASLIRVFPNLASRAFMKGSSHFTSFMDPVIGRMAVAIKSL